VPLPAGIRFGAYEILSALGAGGMGEVYRARDTKLGRSVAIKILPGTLAADPERIARFEREAKMLAALNHPHIAAVYGMEESGGRHYLVMELIEGGTLAERLQRGAMPVEEALKIAHQIVEALEAAHEKGIVHRDLKPANVKVTPGDTVKVLDFGLAKAMADEPTVGARPTAATHSPTLSMMATQAGVILGTAAYMSPEQAKGLPADHRSDVFSFGCVLYEMLTGRQPFQGETVPDVMASVLARDPDLNALPPNLNPRLPDLLKRCLDKHPKRRWQAVGDLRAEIEAIAAAPRAVPAAHIAGPPRPWWQGALPVVAAALVASAITGAVVRTLRPSESSPIVTRFLVTLPEGQTLSARARNGVAISNDGTQIAYVANNLVYVRPMSELAARPLTANDQGTPLMPVFSPDGKSIAFYGTTSRAIKKVAVSGGAVVTIAQTEPPPGISWGADGILFVDPNVKGVMRVGANGGKPERVAAVKEGEVVDGPQMLPDGQHVLFTVATDPSAEGWDKARIVVESLKSHERKTVFEGGSAAGYVATGHIVYAVAGVLFAIPFDARRLEVTGGPTPIVEGVRRSAAGITATAFYGVSDNGSLIFAPGPASGSSTVLDLALIDRKGVVAPLNLPPAPYEFPRVSPDGKRIAVGTDNGKSADIWIYELSGTTTARRLTNGGRNRFPIWSSNSQRIAFQSDREGDRAIFWQPADFSGTAERLTRPDKETVHVPESWSPDGNRFLFVATKGSANRLMAFSVQDKKAVPFGNVESTIPPAASFSPDGRWVSYMTGSSVDYSVFVQPFPSNGSQAFVARGVHPLWSPDGKELFYRAGGQVFAVSVTTQPTFAFGNPVPVASVTYALWRERGPQVERENDITHDGKQFVAVIAGGTTQSARVASESQIEVVLNWFEELKQRVPNR